VRYIAPSFIKISWPGICGRTCRVGHLLLDESGKPIRKDHHNDKRCHASHFIVDVSTPHPVSLAAGARETPLS
jgi:hypothetical protein